MATAGTGQAEQAAQGGRAPIVLDAEMRAQAQAKRQAAAPEPSRLAPALVGFAAWIGRIAPILAIALLVGIVAVAALHRVAVRHSIVSLGYRISAEATRRHRLEEEKRRLKLELATLRAPDRIERLARERLGMVPPDPARIVTLDAAAPGGEGAR